VTQDLYKILQVDPDADTEVIEAAYKRLARRYHPDVNQAAWAEARMKELNGAYQTLRHPRRRALYDGQRTKVNGAKPDGSPIDVHRCYRHPDHVAIESCDGCGADLCAPCAGRFQPPTCAPCVVRWARGQQLGAVVTPMAAALIAVVVGGVSVWAAGRVPEWPRISLGGLALDIPASVAVLCSAAIALLIARALWDLHQLREVVRKALAAP
jgi:hypothetical protein